MTATTQRRWFWIAFAVVTLLIAGGVSYLASSSPDGLDSATLQGCEVIATADGGVTALGTNITNMSVIGVAAGYGTAVLLYGLARRRSAEVPVATVGVIAFLSAVIGTVCAAMGFVVEYALGGAATTSLGAVTAYMSGTHVLIGIGEGIITALTVMAVVRVRPDLVYLLRTRTRSEVLV